MTEQLPPHFMFVNGFSPQYLFVKTIPENNNSIHNCPQSYVEHTAQQWPPELAAACKTGQTAQKPATILAASCVALKQRKHDDAKTALQCNRLEDLNQTNIREEYPYIDIHRLPLPFSMLFVAE